MGGGRDLRIRARREVCGERRGRLESAEWRAIEEGS